MPNGGGGGGGGPAPGEIGKMFWSFRKRKRKLAASSASSGRRNRADEYRFGWTSAGERGRRSGWLTTIIVISAATVAATAAPQTFRRPDSSGAQDSTRLMAVGGQRVDLQCPLLGELLAAAGRRLVWRKDGAPLELEGLSPRHRANNSAATLTIASAQPKLDEGAYECALAPDGGPEKSHRFQLSLLLAPRLAPFECPTEAQVGMKLVLTCAALEGHQPMSFVWLKDDQIVWAPPALGPLAVHAQRHSLGQLHQQQLAEKLAAGSAPTAAASGYLLGAKLQEQEPALAVLTDSGIRIRQADDYSILSIERLELKHSGRYACSVQNEAARAAHSSHLNINAPPTISVEPKDGDFVAGESGRLDCLAAGQPRPTVSWLRARESASRGQWDYVPVYESLRYSLLANGSLQIANMSQREQGLYLCSAKNGFGPEVTKLVRVTVHEPARFQHKFVQLEVRLDERAELVCQAQGELPIRIEWLDREAQPIQHNDKRFIIDEAAQEAPGAPGAGAGGGAAAASAQVQSRLILARSLRQDSGHYTCRAENKHGADKMVTNLLVLDVPHKVGELKVTNVTSSTISVRWQLAFTGNAPVTSYLVQYQSDDPLDDLLLAGHKQDSTATQQQQQSQTTMSSPLANLRSTLEALNGIQTARSADEAIDRTLVELTVEQSQQNLVVKDLVPACLYRLRLAAINKIGLGEFSDWIRARTEEAPPAGTPTKIMATATGPNSVKVTWSPPDRRSWNGQLVGFNIGYRPLDSSYELNKTLEWSAPSFHSLLVDHAQELTKTARRPAEIKELPSTSAPNSSSKETNSSSNELMNLKQHLRQLLALQQQELVAHLTNLQRSTTYLVWLQAANQRGLGPQSHSISVKTLDDVPPSAPSIRVQTSSTSSITIAWSMLSNFVSPANQYSLFYRRVPPLQPGPTRSPLSSLNDSDFASPSATNQEPGPFVERTMSGQQLLATGQVAFLDHQTQVQHQNQNQNLLPPSLTLNDQFMQQQHSGNHQQHYQQFVYTLDQLDCGSTYELYMTTRNSVGKSEPSPVVTTRTLGEPPQAPANRQSLFTRIGATEVALNLASWSSGGCPFTAVSLRYKQVPAPTAASLATNQHHNQQTNHTNQLPPVTTTNLPHSLLATLNGDREAATAIRKGDTTYLLKNLMPSTCYELEIVGHNGAGHTSAQYEFVTANLNGSRAGFSGRKESIFRLGGSQMGANDLLEQQASFGALPRPHEPTGNVAPSTGAQLLPLVLMLLCLLCLIISSTFCYYRLADGWRRSTNPNRRRPSQSDAISCATSAGGKLANGPHGLHCQALSAASNSPGSLDKSTMWRMNGPVNQMANGTLRSAHHQASYHQPDSDQDSPTGPAVHYCLRGGQLEQQQQQRQQQQQHQLQPKQGFSQSVSMKDFNLIPQQPSQTMNFKTYRPRAAAGSLQDSQLAKGATLRPRLFSEAAAAAATTPIDSGNYLATSNQICSVYATTCAGGKQKEPVDITYANQQLAGYGDPTAAAHLFGSNHYRDGSQQQQHQETSWTTGNNYGANAKLRQQTTYAVPAGAAYNSLQQQHQDHHQATYDMNHANLANVAAAASGQLDYGEQQNTYGNCNGNTNNNQTSIDACIQQLMEQQQYQQQYAMLVNNQKQLAAADPDRCIYGLAQENNSNFAQLPAPMSVEMQQLSQQQTKLQLNGNGTQSIIDSSSSSSGIDVGMHLDCISNATSNNSANNSKQMNGNQQQQQQQQHQAPSILVDSHHQEHPFLNNANNLFSSGPTTSH